MSLWVVESAGGGGGGGRAIDGSKLGLRDVIVVSCLEFRPRNACGHGLKRRPSSAGWLAVYPVDEAFLLLNGKRKLARRGGVARKKQNGFNF